MGALRVGTALCATAAAVLSGGGALGAVAAMRHLVGGVLTIKGVTQGFSLASRPVHVFLP